MFKANDKDTDPFLGSAVITAGFLALCAIRLTIPGTPYFDEVHYLPAARALLESGDWLNREHPLLGKEMIALGIAAFGDTPWGWRSMPWLFGGVTLFAGMRAMWFAALSRFAALAFGILLATGFLLFVHARIAMLDIFMTAFFALALWQCAAALRQPETGRWRLAVAGIAIGLSMAAKWNVLFAAMLPGVAFVAARLTAGRRRLWTSQRGIPVPGISVVEAAVWLGIVPLIVYWLTYWPAFMAPDSPLDPGGILALHSDTLDLHAMVKTPHIYHSHWPDWVLNIRSIWYLYEPVDDVQRGIMLIGNPLTMVLGLPAMGWCLWAGAARKRWDAAAIILLYAASLALWMVADKPVQFYYHYFLPSCFLLAGLALVLDHFWQCGMRWLPMTVLVSSIVIFAIFYPILSAAALPNDQAFLYWAWLPSWR